MRWLKAVRIGALLLLTALIGIFCLGWSGLRHIPSIWFTELRGDGWVLFALGQIVIACTGILPASLIGIAAGGAYGIVAGFAMAATTTLSGALIALAASRSLLRPMVARRLYRHKAARTFDRALRLEGWRVACLMRMSPVMPFAATSYLLGLSGLSVRDYILGTLASMPALLGYVLIGKLVHESLHATSDAAQWVRWGLLALGAGATILLTVKLGRMLRASVGSAPDGAAPDGATPEVTPLDATPLDATPPTVDQ